MNRESYRDLDRRLEMLEKKSNLVLDRGYPAGTSFPTGVTNGFLFYRTDCRALFLYDGTTWNSLNNWGAYVANLMSLPALRGLWLMNSYDQNGAPYDSSFQGRTLTNTAATFGLYNNRVPYFDFNGTTANLSRADEAGLDITGTITFGGWFWVDGTTSLILMSKWASGTNNRSFVLQTLASTPVIRVVINSTGLVGANVVCDTAASLPTSAWFHVVVQFNPSTNVIIWVNGVSQTYTTSIPASLFNSNASFRIGGWDDATNYLDGRVSCCFLCTTSLTDSYVVSLYNEGRSFFVS